MKIAFFLLFNGILFASDVIDSKKNEYNPTYLIHLGKYFGGKQTEYLKRSREIIEKTKKTIEERVKSNQDLKALFFQILAEIAQDRKQIALEHQTNGAKHFGERRDSKQPALLCHTEFHLHYKKYGDQILNLLKNSLSKMRQDKKRFIQKKHSAKDNYLGRSSLIEIRIFEEGDTKDFKLGEGRLPEWVLADILNNRNETTEDGIKLHSAFKRLHSEDPEIYSALRWTLGIDLLGKFLARTKRGISRGAFPLSVFSKVIYVQATISFEINGKMEPLYEYLTWLYEDPNLPEADILHKMIRSSTPMVVHQPEVLIEETLKDVANVFEQIVRWDGRNLNQLKQLMALFRYEMACMPFRRGSAAITEWIEAALYAYHKIAYQCDKNRLADLEAYSCPFFSDFFKAYDSMYYFLEF